MFQAANKFLVAIAVVLILVDVGSAESFPKQAVDALFRPMVSPPQQSNSGIAGDPASNGSPGFAVLVVKNGRAAFKQGYGLADLQAKTPVTSSTNFRLASVTKQFTAMAIMLLVHDGKLSYDDKLERFFPEFPSYGRSITIRQLLTHTSGLPDYEDIYEEKFRGAAGDAGAVPQITDDGVLKLLEEQTRGMFAPGTQWHYSNSGYAVLSRVVETVSGESFPEFLKQRIFDPVGMRNTVAFVKGRNEVPHRAFGYRQQQGHWIDSDQSATSAVLGDGGIYSSIDDLQKWDAALANHTVLSATEVNVALRAVAVPGGARRNDGTPVQYGFGWFLDPYHGRARMHHYGETSGFRTTIQRFVDERLTIIILSNRREADVDALALKITDLIEADRRE
jgi:CubicO group peptidase (beta-lactamase class C family)